jgi:small-conductance mechanosensitive channel
MSLRSSLSARASIPALTILIYGLSTAPACAQVPGLPTAGTPKDEAAGTAKPAPTPDSPKATIASSEGKIAVKEAVPNDVMRRTLKDLLDRYPGVRKVDVSADNGFVTIDGQVDRESTHDDVTNFVRRVEGVRLVLNLMRTDDEVMSATELARRQVSAVGTFFARKWFLIVMALIVFLGAMGVARLFGRYSETLLSPFVGNGLLRSVLGSLLGAGILVGGILAALSILDLTQAVLSILGLAGVAGLAIGFAFKDITENFIASVLLGVRRPFRVGDSVQVAGRAGVVQSLNTRATVLITPEGRHVRIPNSVIYKEILVNESASSRTRGSFDVLIPYEASTSEAIAAMAEALRGQDGVQPDPAPRVLVDDLDRYGVRLQARFWRPTKGIDGDQLVSDAKLKVKAALQGRGILVTTPFAGPWPAHFGPAPTPHGGLDGGPSAAGGKAGAGVASREEVHENVRRDAKAAANTAPVADGRTCDLTPGLLNDKSRVEDEGVNLLDNRSDKNHREQATASPK